MSGYGRSDVGQWVRCVRLPSSQKLALMVLFEHAGEQKDGRWGCWASYRTLAWEAGWSDADSIRRHIVALEEAGVVAREDQHRPNGSRTTNFIVLNVGEGALESPPNERGGPTEVGGPPPLPGGDRKPQKEAPPAEGGTRARSRDDTVPDDFPAELRPHARLVLPILRSVAERHGAKAVKVRAVAHTLQARPRKPLVKAAHDFAAWAENPPRPIRDALASYRTWLDREADLAGVERLPGEASPTMNGAGPNVIPMRETAMERERREMRERSEERERKLRASGALPNIDAVPEAEVGR